MMPNLYRLIFYIFCLFIVSGQLHMDLDLLQKFEQKTGIHVKIVFFETDETRDELLAQTQGSGFDVVDVLANRVEGYVNHGWLAPVDSQLVPNLKHIDPRWVQAYPELIKHGVPLFWGTEGIAYRPDLLGGKITKWLELLKPEEKLRKHIIMEKDSRNLLGVALKALGYSWNTVESGQIEKARQLLVAQKSFVRDYGYVGIDQTSGLVNGDVWATMLYNGDAVAVQSVEPRIAYVIPEEGGLLWMDYLAVLEKSLHKAEAYAFINFLHEPENAAQLAQTLHYATTNKSATAMLPADFLNDPVIYPSQAIVDRSEFPQKLPPRVESKQKNILRGLLN
ncbi:MAG: spermidine/putrescine ABC transporter substrate-binding protein [Magnetococcus sp. DMHC-6]